MTIFLGALAIMVVGGAMALLFQRQPRTALTVGFGSVSFGCIAGLFPAIQTLFDGEVLTLRQPWRVPYGELFLQVDALSAFFLLAKRPARPIRAAAERPPRNSAGPVP